MLTHEKITEAVAKTATRFSLKKVSYLGSSADVKETEKNDLDVLVEFFNPYVSLWTIEDFKHRLEEELNISVDVIHAPLSKGAVLEIENTIPVYEKA
jgi:predicted nucleotidyltransferase